MDDSWALPRIPTLLHFAPLRNPWNPFHNGRESPRQRPQAVVVQSPAELARGFERDGLCMHARPGEGRRSAPRCEVERTRYLEPGCETVRKARREAVPSTVGVRHGTGNWRRGERPARLCPAAERSRGRPDETRARGEAAR